MWLAFARKYWLYGLMALALVVMTGRYVVSELNYRDARTEIASVTAERDAATKAVTAMAADQAALGAAVERLEASQAALTGRLAAVQSAVNATRIRSQANEDPVGVERLLNARYAELGRLRDAASRIAGVDEPPAAAGPNAP